MRRKVASVLGMALVLGFSLALAACGGGGKSNKLEIFSWWTAGGEAEGLNAMFSIYQKQYPNVQIVNATTAGGAGTNAKAVLSTRLTGGDPPDSFQLHAGLEVQSYDPEKYLQPLDALYKSEGLDKVFPKDLLSLLQYKGHYWGVPVNIHRANVLWYNKKLFDDNKLEPPATWDDFFKVAKVFKAKKIIPLAIGTKEGWESGHTFETILVSVLGADGYKGLWTGTTRWTDPKVTKALETYKQILPERQHGLFRPRVERRRAVPGGRQGRHAHHGRLDGRLVHLEGLHGVRLADRSRGRRSMTACPTASRCPRAPRTRPTR